MSLHQREEVHRAISALSADLKYLSSYGTLTLPLVDRTLTNVTRLELQLRLLRCELVHCPACDDGEDRAERCRCECHN